VTVLELDRPVSAQGDSEYVSMTPLRDERFIAGAEQRRLYLQALRARIRNNPAPLELPVEPVIGRGQTEVAPDEVKAIVPAYNRSRRHRNTTI
jgi:hypothetical protein